MLNRHFQNWVYATPPIALLLIGLYPFIGSTIALPLYLSLPVYMAHQFEEHDNNRFSKFIKGMMGEDKKGVTPFKVWVGNVIFVWFLILAIFYIEAAFTGWGVFAAHLMITNALLHIIWLVKLKKPNPGLWTAILLFIPCSVWIFSSIPATLTMHAVSLIIAVFLQAGVLIMASKPA
ncbi:HXXEE domain-containing protein [Tropicibacter sp. Alg240-R139]|uniref:HXXEE domain-containing protein n=1 Tax=Tropicibacter sp. Alg240-R139 TaxID=2305991 RepID=UPI0013DF5E6D|nr:HXXEE domain-containing protein [Tropicibacter sp. Alg240-R139]